MRFCLMGTADNSPTPQERILSVDEHEPSVIRPLGVVAPMSVSPGTSTIALRQFLKPSLLIPFSRFGPRKGDIPKDSNWVLRNVHHPLFSPRSWVLLARPLPQSLHLPLFPYNNRPLSFLFDPCDLSFTAANMTSSHSALCHSRSSSMDAFARFHSVTSDHFKYLSPLDG